MEKRIHYSWVIVAGAFLLAASGTAILVNCIGVFIKPISVMLGIPRGKVALFYTFASTATMLFSPVMGLVLKKFDLRKVVVLCSAGASLTLAGYAFCKELWQFYLTGFVCGIFTCGLTSMMISTLISRWFEDKKGLALGIAFSGSGVSSIVLNPLVSTVIETMGWRTGFGLLAIILSAINIPTALFLIKSFPGDMGCLPYGHKERKDTVSSLDIPRREALRMGSFWLLLLGMFLCGLVATGVQQHINAYLTDVGHTTTFSAFVFSMSMAFLIPGKLVLGWVFDRKGPRWGMSTICVCFAISMVCLLNATQSWGPYLFGVSFGAAYTILSLPATCLTMDFFGSAHYSENYGVVTMFMCGGMALGSPVSAFLYDTFGSYRVAWVIYALLAVAIWVLILAAARGVELQKKKFKRRSEYEFSKFPGVV